MNPAQPGLQFHKLAKTKDPSFWSVRVNNDVRIIAHRSQSSLVLCYVAHHDNAYQWAERRRLETHPKTGAAQLVEVRETVQEITVPVYVEREQETPPKPPLFAEIADSDLLGYGVPELNGWRRFAMRTRIACWGWLITCRVKRRRRCLSWLSAERR